MASGASHSDSHKTLALTAVTGQNQFNQVCDVVQEPLRLRLGQYVVGHCFVGTAARTQLRYPIGVGEKTDVEKHVGIARRTVLKPKGLDGNLLNLASGIRQLML